MATTSRRTPATSLNPHVSRDTTPTATDPTAPPAITASVTADEVIAPGTTIELTFNAEVDAQSAQGAIRVQHRCEQVAANVTLSKRGRLATVQLDDTAIGAHSLVVSELLTAKGEKLVDNYRLPFSIIPVSGKIPPELRI